MGFLKPRRQGEKRIVHRGFLRCVAVAACVTLAALFLRAQYIKPRNKGPHTGPRAVAVLEQLPPQKGSTKPSTHYRIVPVTIFYQGQYYDGESYKASPVPMALMPQTVYDVERGGSPSGTFEVGLASPTPEGWRSDGTLAEASTKEPEHKPALGTETAKQPSDDRPRLHRGSDQSAATSQPNTSPTPGTSSIPAGGASASSAAVASANSDSSIQEQDDPNRPKLQRGKPMQSSGASAAEANTTAEEIKPSAQRPPDLVAISDVEASDPHVYTLQWSKSDLDRLTQAATQQAQAAVAKYVKEHFPSASPQPAAQPSRSSGRKRTAARSIPSTAPMTLLQDVDVHAFDLDFDNDPEIVLTARQSVTGADGNEHFVFVAYVVREEGGRDYHPLLTYITDDTRLDEFPKLKLIDAVDADGDGIAELLFRASSAVEAQEENFRLYATGPDRLRIVFDSRGAQD